MHQIFIYHQNKAWYIPHLMETFAVSLKLASNVIFHSPTERREHEPLLNLCSHANLWSHMKVRSERSTKGRKASLFMAVCWW